MPPSNPPPSLSFCQRLRFRQSAVRSAAIDRAVHLFTRVRYAMPDARPSRFHLRVTKDVVYGSSSRACHRLDVYTPLHAPQPRPVVMYVHGGAFTMLSKETHFVMAMQFARRGYLVFNINYRLGHKNPFPAPLEDACDALVWVHRHAREYGGDPARIAIAGESAGGNLVAALAIACAAKQKEPFAERLFNEDVRPRATISTYPFLDLTSIERHFAHPRVPFWAKELIFDAASAYVGAHVYEVSRAAPLASPVRLLETESLRLDRPLSPFFLSCGTRDLLLGDSKRLKAVLDRRGVACELFVAPGEIHGFDAMVWRPAAKAKWRAAHAFLEKHMAVARRPEVHYQECSDDVVYPR